MEKLPKDREHFVLDNLNMVHYVLNNQLHIHNGHPNYDDYFQEGCVGLIISAIRFDESKGFRFSTFAFPNIYGMIKKYRRDSERIIKIPSKLKDVIFQVLRYRNQGFTPEEIMEITGITAEDIQDSMNVTLINSLDTPIHVKDDKNTLSITDTISDPTDAYRYLIDENHIMDIIQIVSDSITNDKWKGIWEEYIYGLLFGEKLTQEYFANKYGFSQAHVSRKLREFKNLFLKEFTT